MEKQWLLYTTIHFIPYRAGEEFINIGIILLSPKDLILKHKICDYNNQRIKAIFPYLTGGIVKSNIDYFDKTIEWHEEQLYFLKNEQELVCFGTNPIMSFENNSLVREKLTNVLWKNIIQPKEGVVVFRPKTSSVLSDDMDKTLDDLYSEYVEHKKEFLYEHSNDEEYKGMKNVRRA